MNATTQNVWTSYRDGRRVMHYMPVEGGHLFVQKVEDGYSVSLVGEDGISHRKALATSLATGKAWAEDYAARAFADTPLEAIKAKFSEPEIIVVDNFDEVTRIIEVEGEANEALKALMARPTRFVGGDCQMEVVLDSDIPELPPGYFEGRIVNIEIHGEAASCGFDADGKPGALRRGISIEPGYSEIHMLSKSKGIKLIVVRRKAK